MAQGYVLTIRDIFNAKAEEEAFAAIKADMAAMSDARMKSEQSLLGTMVIEVDADSALQVLQNKYNGFFHFEPELQMRAG
jgi:hypothetical protein